MQKWLCGSKNASKNFYKQQLSTSEYFDKDIPFPVVLLLCPTQSASIDRGIGGELSCLCHSSSASVQYSARSIEYYSPTPVLYNVSIVQPAVFIPILSNIHDLIPTSLLLQLEAGRNFETFIASTSGLKPFWSTELLQFVAFQYNNKLLQKCTILHEGLCQWPLWKPQDNGKAQSNMTKQSARSVPKIEQHELNMVTKCTEWAQNSNTNVEQIRLRINRTH